MLRPDCRKNGEDKWEYLETRRRSPPPTRKKEGRREESPGLGKGDVAMTNLWDPGRGKGKIHTGKGQPCNALTTWKKRNDEIQLSTQ